MASRREVQKIAQMVKRKYYAGICFGFALAAGIGAGGLHALADPTIANSTLAYSIDRQALHGTLLFFRNIAAGAAILTFVMGFFLDQSVSDIAK